MDILEKALCYHTDLHGNKLMIFGIRSDKTCYIVYVSLYEL